MAEPLRPQVETRAFEVVVVGGGLAGLCAALASARRGVSTALVTDRPVLGGNSSSEVRVVPLGASSKTAWSKETGIIEELLLTDRATNPADVYDNGTMNRWYDLTLYEAARNQPGLTLFLNTYVDEVKVEAVGDEDAPYERRIVSVVGSQSTSARRFEFTASQFLDCTGDATVGWLAGADYRLGREARAEFHEPMAPAVADEATMGSTICMRAIDYGKAAPYAPPPWAKQYRSQKDFGVVDRVIQLSERPELAGFWWVEIGQPYHQVTDAEEIKSELIAHVLGVWDYMKNYGPERERLATFGLEWIGMLPGKRESRRLMGDVILTEADEHVDRRWPDRISHAGWYIDQHTVGGILNIEEPAELSHADESYYSWTHVAPFTIPLRSSYSRNVANLWMSGRILSTSHVGLGPVRVQATLALHGQAVGTAAAMATAAEVSPRTFSNPEGGYLDGLHQALLREDLHVMGASNTDADDLARTATLTASSDAALDLGEPATDAWEPLDRPRGQVMLASSGRVDEVSVFVRNLSSEAVTVPVELHQLDRIWDRDDGITVATAQLVVPASYEGWLTVGLNAAVSSSKPCRLALGPARSVSWARAIDQPVGTLAQFRHESSGGPFRKENERYPVFQKAQTDLPAFTAWSEDKWFSMATRLVPESRPFPVSSVVNGVAWPIDAPNLWIADPTSREAQHVELAFDSEVTIGHVQVTFDTGMNHRYRDLPGLWRAPTCARRWRLLGLIRGSWTVLAEENDNFLRRRVVRFAPVHVTALRVEFPVDEDQDAIAARLYEIRAYEDPGVAFGGPAELVGAVSSSEGA